MSKIKKTRSEIDYDNQLERRFIQTDNGVLDSKNKRFIYIWDSVQIPIVGSSDVDRVFNCEDVLRLLNFALGGEE